MRIEFILKGQKVYEGDCSVQKTQDVQLLQDDLLLNPVKNFRNKKQVKFSHKNQDNKKQLHNQRGKKRRGAALDEDTNIKLYAKDIYQDKRKKQKKNADDESGVEYDSQASEDEQKLLELEGELEMELANIGDEEMDEFEDEDQLLDENDLEKQKPIAKILNNPKLKEAENLSELSLSENPVYQKLTQRQKNIIKNTVANQFGVTDQQQQQQQQQELQLEDKKKKKDLTEEDLIKKQEKEEKRRLQMQKQIENLKKQTVDKILNEAGTKQKKRKEREQQETNQRTHYQYRQLHPNEPRITYISNSNKGEFICINKNIYNPYLNPVVQQ
ncbi:hypothetical protein IMG5_204020 [Ichthyophthirius multifiliis]|uniref:INO80 complex subunit B-like conserved region domain-containing protein n=1 Tax=Ichthyophthirius multifiliis TaxID=5932 RepID=G0R6F1_ICHMU|nr:hypothetical protein IMG5_204020 [Ichthyophthirius multifiliis]EGR26951.1 hypothetical protein IMG5_204020 [Ichthyophthirius multifiliis]|eukprot:XP_004023835.1 hypothetical protein IMG5_204020 [Ichthyophthirius multifiliis]